MRFFSQVKIYFVFLLVTLFIFSAGLVGQDLDRSKAPEAGPAPQIKIGSYESFELENGLKCFVVENRKLPRVSFRLSIDSDPYLEGDKMGLSGMMGQLLRMGTESKSKEEIDEAVDFIGARLSTSSAGVSASCLTRHTEALLEVMSDVLLHPSFPEEELEKIKTQELSGLESNLDDAGAIARVVGRALRYGKDHPYGEVLTEASLIAVTREDCRELFEKEFIPNQAYLVIVGDMDVSTAKKYTEKYFSAWKSGELEARNFDFPEVPSTTQLNVVNKEEAAQSVVTISFPIDLKPGTEDVLPTSVLNDILGGGGFSSRLFQNLREDKAYTYGAYSALRSDRQVGYFAAQASVRNEVTDSSIVEFLYEINRLVKEPVEQEELQLMLNIMSGDFARALERPETVARFALNIERYNLPKDYYETYLERLAKVTAEDVQRVAKKYLRLEHANILVVGSKEEVFDKLKRFSATGKVQEYDAYANIIEEKPEELDAPKVDPREVLENYLQACGGKKKLSKVKGNKVVAVMEAGGFTVDFHTAYEQPDKYKLEVSMAGNNLQSLVINGSKGYQKGMQKTGEMNAEEIESALEKAAMFPQLQYLEDPAYKLESNGLASVNGEEAHKLFIYDSENKKTVEFYSVSSHLLLKRVSSEETEQGKQMEIQEFTMYEELDGIKIPHEIEMSAAGQKSILKMKLVELNPTFPTGFFEIK